MREKEKLVSCYRGMFPDIPFRLTPEELSADTRIMVLISGAQKICGQECPADCGYRQLVESFEANKKKLTNRGS